MNKSFTEDLQAHSLFIHLDIPTQVCVETQEFLSAYRHAWVALRISFMDAGISKNPEADLAHQKRAYCSALDKLNALDTNFQHYPGNPLIEKAIREGDALLLRLKAEIYKSPS